MKKDKRKLLEHLRIANVQFGAPAKGSDADFDQMADSAWRAVLFIGNPDSLTEETVRQKLATAFGQYAGRTYGSK